MNKTNPGTLTLWNRMKGGGGRGDRSALGMWFWDIDRMLLLLTLLLIAVGLIAVGAASPAAATR
jgi:cell division protein FtsW